MDKRLRAFLIFASAVLTASPAWANAPPSSGLGVLSVLVIPILMLILLKAGGAGPILEAKGVKPRSTLEIIVSLIIVAFFSALSAIFAIPALLAICFIAVCRSIQMLYWGLQAQKPVGKRASPLAGADPARLLTAGGSLIIISVVLTLIGLASIMNAVMEDGHFGRLIRKSNEGASKGNLGSIRSALSIYFKDMGGVYPSSLDQLTIGGKYLPAIPRAKAPSYHTDSNAVHPGKASNDAGGWLYNNDPKDKDFGDVLVNCAHTDTKGSFWTAY
ncbi:MAG: hypothetical protein HZB91_11675 [Elusimicrobia bacterium]|nr:hypothetical protein [Elusimicrobiota bacterium]